MQRPLQFETLLPSHLDELATVLLHPAVYEHIADSVPSRETFTRNCERALVGPAAGSTNQIWLNYLVRGSSGMMIGRLEATLHDSVAEVAFLFGPCYWGNGYASEGLQWLHSEITRGYDISTFWATTVPENTRCQRVLRRTGYAPALQPFPMLFSYSAGDLAFVRVDRSAERRCEFP